MNVSKHDGPTQGKTLSARHLIIRGRVQGVGYRWSMQQAAHRLSLGGWVRNRSDGKVEAVVCGAQDAVAAIIHWAATGPAGADVEAVEVEEWTESECPVEFELRPTI